MPTYTQQSVINAPAEAVFNWHLQPDAFEQLTPPWEPVTVVEQTGPISQIGSRTTIKLNVLGFIPLYWVAEHTAFSQTPETSFFRDVQLSGPFAAWTHTHTVEALTDTTCQYTDHIEYRVPLGILGQLAAGWMVKRKLKRMFTYRHQVVAQALES